MLSTSVIQSSGAVVALVISFTAISLLPLSQSLAVVLGADLGSTVTVQILSFRTNQYAFLFVLERNRAPLRLHRSECYPEGRLIRHKTFGIDSPQGTRYRLLSVPLGGAAE